MEAACLWYWLDWTFVLIVPMPIGRLFCWPVPQCVPAIHYYLPRHSHDVCWQWHCWWSDCYWLPDSNATLFPFPLYPHPPNNPNCSTPLPYHRLPPTLTCQLLFLPCHQTHPLQAGDLMVMMRDVWWPFTFFTLYHHHPSLPIHSCCVCMPFVGYCGSLLICDGSFLLEEIVYDSSVPLYNSPWFTVTCCSGWYFYSGATTLFGDFYYPLPFKFDIIPR